MAEAQVMQYPVGEERSKRRESRRASRGQIAGRQQAHSNVQQQNNEFDAMSNQGDSRLRRSVTERNYPKSKLSLVDEGVETCPEHQQQSRLRRSVTDRPSSHGRRDFSRELNSMTISYCGKKIKVSDLFADGDPILGGEQTNESPVSNMDGSDASIGGRIRTLSWRSNKVVSPKRSPPRASSLNSMGVRTTKPTDKYMSSMVGRRMTAANLLLAPLTKAAGDNNSSRSTRTTGSMNSSRHRESRNSLGGSNHSVRRASSSTGFFTRTPSLRDDEVTHQDKIDEVFNRWRYSDKDVEELATDDKEFLKLKKALKKSGAVTNEFLKQQLFVYMKNARMKKERAARGKGKKKRLDRSSSDVRDVKRGVARTRSRSLSPLRRAVEDNEPEDEAKDGQILGDDRREDSKPDESEMQRDA